MKVNTWIKLALRLAFEDSVCASFHGVIVDSIPSHTATGTKLQYFWFEKRSVEIPPM